jgi:hypothetical protein
MSACVLLLVPTDWRPSTSNTSWDIHLLTCDSRTSRRNTVNLSSIEFEIKSDRLSCKEVEHPFLVAPHRLHHLFNAAGISEPMQMAETFTFPSPQTSSQHNIPYSWQSCCPLSFVPRLPLCPSFGTAAN